MSEKWKAAMDVRRRQRELTQCWRDTRVVTSAQQPFVCIDGQWVTNFSSNDYLGLAADPRVSDAIERGLSHWGNGSAASHMVTGHSKLHSELSERLACWVGAEKAILFSTGYMANIAVNTALFDKQDLLLHDKLNHASLIDGARLSSGKLRRFAHSNVQHARQILLREDFDRFAIFVDGVFSMDGDCAPLKELSEIVERQDGLLIVDDAHGLGVLGVLGAGTLSYCGLKPNGSHLMVGTLGKALGGFGAFVAGDREFIDELAQASRSYLYTTAMSNAVAIGNLAALDVMESEGGRLLTRLYRNIKRFREGCERADIPVSNSITPIQPITLGDTELTMEVASRLFDRGVMVAAIRTPTVKAGTERLRITVSAAHTHDQIDLLVECLSECLDEVSELRTSAIA